MPFAQRLYCYYIVIVSFTKKIIVVILVLCHSPKIVMLLHKRNSRVCRELSGMMKIAKSTDFAKKSPKNAKNAKKSSKKCKNANFNKKILKIVNFVTKNMYCCYIGAVSFTKNCIVVTLELCHSPKIVFLLHWSCFIRQKLYCCYTLEL